MINLIPGVGQLVSGICAYEDSKITEQSDIDYHKGYSLGLNKLENEKRHERLTKG